MSARQTMGPLERAIRDFGRNVQVNHDALHVIEGAARSLGFEDMFQAYTTGPKGHVEDVLSEAIEAAAELGL